MRSINRSQLLGDKQSLYYSPAPSPVNHHHTGPSDQKPSCRMIEFLQHGEVKFLKIHRKLN